MSKGNATIFEAAMAMKLARYQRLIFWLLHATLTFCGGLAVVLQNRPTQDAFFVLWFGDRPESEGERQML